MEPVALILAALAAGAAGAAKETAATIVKDGYEGLKGLLKKWLSGKPLAIAAVDLHQQDGKAAEAVIGPALRDTGAGADRALIEAARALLAKADPEGAIAARYHVNIAGDVGAVSYGSGNTFNVQVGAKPGRG